MFRFLVIFSLGVISLGPAVSAADEQGLPDCAGYDLTGLTEGRPVIRVEPMFGDNLRSDSVDSCIVVTFGLREKRGTNGEALLAHKPKSVAWSEEVPRSARKAAQRALTKWLFLAKTQPASDDPVYFYVFTF